MGQLKARSGAPPKHECLHEHSRQSLEVFLLCRGFDKLLCGEQRDNKQADGKVVQGVLPQDNDDDDDKCRDDDDHDRLATSGLHPHLFLVLYLMLVVGYEGLS